MNPQDLWPEGPSSAGHLVGRAAGLGPLAVLERIRRPAHVLPPVERCELCGNEVSESHSHVVNLDSRGLLCVCRACYLLFTQKGAGSGRYQAVPDRVLAVTDFSVTSNQWEALQIPVAVSFFFHNSDLDRIAAFYPSPAGATECLLPLGAWEGIVAGNPALSCMSPDVEAVLVRVRGDARDCYIVPIDACYELVGILRTLWRGFDGGREVHEAVEVFFDSISARARPAPKAQASASSDA